MPKSTTLFRRGDVIVDSLAPSPRFFDHLFREQPQEFLLIRPTRSNLKLYEEWITSPTQSQVFFGDLADTCYRYLAVILVRSRFRRVARKYCEYYWMNMSFIPTFTTLSTREETQALHLPALPL